MRPRRADIKHGKKRACCNSNTSSWAEANRLSGASGYSLTGIAGFTSNFLLKSALVFPLTSVLTLTLATTLLFTGTAQAVTLYWDGATTTGDADGGTGTWDNGTTSNWDDAASAGTDTAWNNATPDIAIFGGTAGTVTLGEAITADSLQFDTTGYTVTGSTLTLSGSSTVTANQDTEIQSIIAGTAGLTKAGTGTLTVTGVNTYTGDTTVSAGTLQIGGAGRLGGGDYSGNIAVANGATFQYSSSATNTDAIYRGDISGDGTLIKDGNDSTLRLQGTTTVANLEINQGTLRSQGVNGAGGAGTTISLGDTSGSNFATLWYTATAATAPTKAGIVVRAGSSGTKSIANTTTGGALIENTAITLNDDLTINDSALMTLGGVISGSGGLTKTGDGTTTLSGNNTYTGANDVQAGTLRAGSTTAFGDNSATTVASGAVLELDGNNNSIGSLAGAGTVENANATAATLTTGGDNTSTTFSGVLQDGTGGGALSLTKVGSGTLTLSGLVANTYSGGTTINAGTVSLGTGGGVTSHQDALGTGAATVNSGGQLRLWIENSGSYTIDNAFTMDGGRVYAEDGLYDLSGAMTLNAGGGTLAGKYSNKQ